jgi:hypothetical protein
MFRGRFRVDDFEGERGEVALELLGGGESVVVGDRICLTCTEGRLLVEVASAWHSVAAITQEVADAELRAAHETVDGLLNDPAFAKVVGNRERQFELVIDYDTGSVLVATLHDGVARLRS